MDLTQNPFAQPQAPQQPAPQGGFNAMLNNPLQGVSAPPPQNPQEVDSRRGQWSQILEDPNMKAALFRMGLQMLQGPGDGEDAMGATARAGMDAMDFYAARNELDRRNAAEGRKEVLDTRNTDSQIEARGVAMDNDRAQIEERSVKLDEWKSQSDIRRKTLDQEVANLQATGRLTEARAKVADFETAELKRKADFIAANPKLADAMQRAEMALPAAKLNTENAQAASGYASAANSRSAANQRDKEAYRDERTWDYMTAEERKAMLLNPSGSASRGGAAGDEPSPYAAQAESILSEYNRLPEKDKLKYGTVDNYVTQNFNVSLGKSASGVLGEIKRLQRGGSGAAPADGGKTFNAQDLAETAADPRNKGKSPEQIRKALEAKGYKYIGE